MNEPDLRGVELGELPVAASSIIEPGLRGEEVSELLGAVGFVFTSMNELDLRGFELSELPVATRFVFSSIIIEPGSKWEEVSELLCAVGFVFTSMNELDLRGFELSELPVATGFVFSSIIEPASSWEEVSHEAEWGALSSSSFITVLTIFAINEPLRGDPSLGEGGSINDPFLERILGDPFFGANDIRFFRNSVSKQIRIAGSLSIEISASQSSALIISPSFSFRLLTFSR